MRRARYTRARQLRGREGAGRSGGLGRTRATRSTFVLPFSAAARRGSRAPHETREASAPAADDAFKFPATALMFREWDGESVILWDV